MQVTSERPPRASTAAPRSPARRNMPASSTRDALVHGCVVTSTIAKGRITRIDASEALRVAGVIDVLTHENRPHMARTDRSLQGGRVAARLAVAAALRRQDPAQRPAGRAGAGRGMGDREVRRRRWCRSNTRRKRMRPISRANAARRSSRRSRSRAAMPRRRWRRRRSADAEYLAADRASQCDGAARRDGDPRERRQAHGLRQDARGA